MTDLIQELPLELWAEIFNHASVPDILRVKQVNRTFRDAILASPLILHKIDLYSTGLEYNAATRVSLPDSKKALVQYRSSMSSLHPTGKRSVVVAGVWRGYLELTSGVYALLEDSIIRLFNLGSASRGILCKEWEISLPVIQVNHYCFYPGADVIAFLDVQNWSNLQLEIYPRTLSDGGYHPAARHPTIYYSKIGVLLCRTLSFSISSSKLVALLEVQLEKDPPTGWRVTRYLVVWDWKNAQVLFELEGEHYNTVEFIDDNRLLVSLRSTNHAPLSLALVDAREGRGGTPIQTFLHLSPSFVDSEIFSLHLEQGAHTPFPEESLAPFHQDPMQRIVALEIGYSPHYLVLQLETLLELVKSRAGSEIGWDEWRDHVVIASSGPNSEGIWVSGCRLFCICDGDSIEDLRIKVHDFSARGLAKYLGERAVVDRDPELKAAFPSGARCMSFTEASQPFPRGNMRLQDIRSGRDNLLFYHWDESDEDHVTLQIWAFS